MTFYDVKEDWSGAKKRWEAWWNFEMLDRPVIVARTGKNNAVRPPELQGFKYEDTDFVRMYTDVNYMIDKMLHEFYGTYYGGEAVPLLYHGYAVGHAMTFGCEPHFEKDTIWTDTVPIKEGEEYPDIRFDPENRWWKLFLDITEKAARASKQRYFMMSKWGNLTADNLLLCRGTENLLFDMIENPEWVKKTVKYMSDAQKTQFDALDELVPLTGLEGWVNAVDCWAPGKTQAFDADFSAMISPEMFSDVFMPPMTEIMQTVDYNIYHLDGITSLQHLDMLLNTKEIHAIQWVAGDGHWAPMQWVPLLQKIQAHKKAVYCYSPPELVVPLAKELKGEGLCIHTWPDNEDAAKRLIEDVAKLYR